MKKILLFSLFCLACLTAQAQDEKKEDQKKQKPKVHYRVSMYIGRTFISVTELNQFLREASLNTLSGTASKALISLSLADDEEDMTNIIEFGYLGQGLGTDARSTNLQSIFMGTHLGYRVINTQKHILMPILGYTFSEGTRLNVVNATPAPNTFSAQLTSPNSTLTQLTYQARSFVHAGLEYRFKNRFMDIGVRAGHYFRLSRGKWYTANPNAPLSDVPTFNQLGTYFSLLFGF